jgi:ArsR family transcriptional regulator
MKSARAGADKTAEASPGECNLPDEISEAIEEIGGLENLAAHVPTAQQINKQAKIHHVLSDKTRLLIMWALNCCDLCPCVLVSFLKIQNTRLSYHLGVLEDAGLVRSYPKKNWKIYTITRLGREVLACSHDIGAGVSKEMKRVDGTEKLI